MLIIIIHAGRKEIIILFVFYMLQSIVQLITSGGWLYLTQIGIILSAVQIGLAMAIFWCLLLNGLVGYQLVEDGSFVSFFGIFFSTLAVAVGVTLLGYDIQAGLFGSILYGGEAYASAPMWGINLIFPFAAVLIYTVLETVLVVRNLGEKKPLSK